MKASIENILAVGASFALMSTGAFAGLTQTAPVNVDFATGFALGDMITARDTVGSTEFNGCGTRVTEDGAGGVFEFGFCQAEDADGDNLNCFTTNRDLLNAMKATRDSSFITSSFVDDGGGDFTCTRIGFSTQSFYLRKK